MMEKQNCWNRSKTVLVIKNFTTLEELVQIRKEISNAGVNVNECVIMAIVESKKALEALVKQDSFVLVSEQQFNFFGKLKNERANEIFQGKYDMILIIGDLSKRIKKKTRGVSRKISIGVNCANFEVDINLTTNETSPAHLINFVKTTLEKIE